ncbi:uncharacterized protein TNIN_232491 [Trichonephila inaurata madagascariensis]|uniref:EF-hand domain-containing protein n=1 Tax=Trichonephila inaurata madagascariensis TaxID=2747483 RepID=A0A8X6Y7D4_9ARAC|nr:uncharacterized protein TNIN_232491 [Trichonephila inaurata madagascariensis]
MCILLQFDNEGFGEIPWDDFLVALESPDFQECIEPSKREVLASKAREHRTYAITFDDFVAVQLYRYGIEHFSLRPYSTSSSGKRWPTTCRRHINHATPLGVRHEANSAFKENVVLLAPSI